jgi:hypothetical protein
VLVHTEIKAVRSIEIRGITSTSSSEAMSSSSGGVIEFRKEGGSAIVEKPASKRDKIIWSGHVMRRVVTCLVNVQSRLLRKSSYMPH